VLSAKSRRFSPTSKKKFVPSNVDTMSTRIIIKNLPHNITPTRLKSHFSSSQSGTTYFAATVTDAKLVTDPKSGKSRGFAFVGYKTPEEAQNAVEWFNGTFVDMRKVSAEIAKPVLSILWEVTDCRLVTNH
jgi:RNA recognition motif-containing protein